MPAVGAALPTHLAYGLASVNEVLGAAVGLARLFDCDIEAGFRAPQ